VRESPTRGLEDSVSNGHLSDGAIAGYLDHVLDPDERRRVESHLDACAECRREVIEAMRVADSYEAPVAKHGAPPGQDEVTRGVSAPRSRAWRGRAVLAGGALMAAGLAGVLLLRPAVSPPEPSAVRGPKALRDDDGQARIRTVHPAEGATVSAHAIAFVWRPTGADAYRLVLLTESGDPVWTHETADTSAALPAGVTLRPGESYFWRVDAIADGIAATTGVHRLQVRP
jgi:hypothetical protein